MTQKNISKSSSEENKKTDVLMQEFSEAAFEASVGVSVTQSGRWTNINIALFGGRTFSLNNRKCMSVSLTRQGLFDLISQLQKARELQHKEIERSQEGVEEVDTSDDWDD